MLWDPSKMSYVLCTVRSHTLLALVTKERHTPVSWFLTGQEVLLALTPGPSYAVPFRVMTKPSVGRRPGASASARGMCTASTSSVALLRPSLPASVSPASCHCPLQLLQPRKCPRKVGQTFFRGSSSTPAQSLRDCGEGCATRRFGNHPQMDVLTGSICLSSPRADRTCWDTQAARTAGCPVLCPRICPTTQLLSSRCLGPFQSCREVKAPARSLQFVLFLCPLSSRGCSAQMLLNKLDLGKWGR